MARASKRELVLDTAEALFIRNGYTATGINQITQEAGIASMTLYNNFKNKDALVMAVLERHHERIFKGLDEALAEAGPNPADRVIAVFDFFEDLMDKDIEEHDGLFTGCAFSHAASEFRELDHPVHQIAANHKQRIVEVFAGLAKELKMPNPDSVAQTLLLLIDGAQTSAQVMGDLDGFDRARAVAEVLIGAEA